MKKKLILFMLISMAMMCLLAFSISATAINKDTTVTLNGSFTMSEGSVVNPVVNLYDEDGYALVWYLNTDNKLVSDRAVNLISVTDNKAKFNDVSKFYGGSQQKGVVVVNLRDDFVNDGISGIEKFDSNFQFGYYGANRNVPIQYFYFPKTATEIIDRMFQNTQLIIADIEPGTPITYMGIHAVVQTNLKEFFVPKGIPEFIEKDDIGIFQDTQLEKITFEEGSQITVIPYRCFYMCKNLKEVILPNSVEEIHYRAFQLSLFGTEGKLEKLVLGANFKGFKGTAGDNFYIRGAANVKVYFPATFSAENVDVSSAHQYFTLCPNATFYYCGTEAQWDALITEISKGKNGATGNDSGENIITAKANGKVIFDYNPCEAFYKGVHSTSQKNPCVAECLNCEYRTVNHVSDYESVDVEYEKGFMANGKMTVTCKNEGCEHNVIAEAPALFVCLGYSAQSYGNGGILVGFGVNNKAISEYADITGDEFKFGMFAGRDVKLGENDAVNVNGEALTGIASVDYTARGFDIVEFKVVGFVTDEHKDANLALGIYVIDGETVSYVQASKPNEGEKYSFVSYNDIVEMP